MDRFIIARCAVLRPDGTNVFACGRRYEGLVRVLVGLVQKAGTYYFVLRVWDNHAHLHKDHQVKPALEMNAEYKTRKIQIAWMPMRKGQNFGNNPGNGQPGTKIGKRIFPDLPVPPDQLPPNDERGAYARAKVVVTVYDQPNKNLTVYLRLLDPDDPSSKTSPIDANDDDPFFDTCRPGDNRASSGFQGQGVGPSDGWGRISDIDVPATTNAQGVGRAFVTVLLPRQPGDNLKVSAALDQWVRDAMYIGQGSQGDALWVWVSSSGFDWKVPEGNESDTNPPARATELLTIWRRLHVEVDSMGVAPVQGPFIGEPYEPDDLYRGEIPDPDIGALNNAFRIAYITVLRDTHKDDSDTEFREEFGGFLDLVNYFLGATPFAQPGEQPEEGYRGTWKEEIDWWSVYVCGIYEVFEDISYDNDPDNELGTIGGTFPSGPLGESLPYAEMEFSLIMEEVLRDVAVDRGWTDTQKARVRQAGVLHEIGHHFELEHYTGEPEDIMWASDPQGNEAEEEDKMTTVPLRFKDQNIAKIRDTKKP